MKNIIIIFLFIVSAIMSKAQNEPVYPEVGKNCPNFILTDIKYYSRKQASLHDFAGKWLILDFWSRNCAGCIASFPKTNRMQNEFQNKVQFMLVAIEGQEVDKEQLTRAIFDKFREKGNLILPCAFDSLLYKRFDIGSCPHIIILDQHGIVRGVTNSINSNDINEFLDGKTPELPVTYKYAHEPEDNNGKIPYDSEKPFLLRGNGADESDFLVHSVLTAFKPAIHNYSIPSAITDENVKEGKFQVLGAPLFLLFNYAYFGRGRWNNADTSMYGKYFNRPILKVKDSSIFQYNGRSGKNIFSYSLVMHAAKASKEIFFKKMKHDLQDYFGIEGEVQLRKCPYWKLVATDQARLSLKTKGEPESFKGTFAAGYTAKNWPIKNLIYQLSNGVLPGNYPILDETGITGNIDLTVDWLNNDFDSIKKALEANGLNLVQDEKEMKVLIIKDVKYD
jgi:thiol-disulfide isomerase/thioredoxin